MVRSVFFLGLLAVLPVTTTAAPVTITETLDDNAVPAGWDLINAPTGPGSIGNGDVRNGRLEASWRDQQARLTYTLPEIASSITVSARGNVEQLYWGSTNQLTLLGDGISSSLTLNHESETGSGDSYGRFDQRALLSGTGGVKDERALPAAFDSGSDDSEAFAYSMTLTGNAVTGVIESLETGISYSFSVSDLSFTAADITGIRFRSSHNAGVNGLNNISNDGGATWLDDLTITYTLFEAAPPAVPLPGAVPLMLAGVLGLCARRACRRWERGHR